jgi:very-short-patch-repair endonuclease
MSTTSITEAWVERARAIHGDKYDYSKARYVSYRSKIIIICPIHGQFQQPFSSHMSGSGCQKCNRYALMDTDEFIRRAKLKHGTKYDYGNVKYEHSNDYINIKCNKCGRIFTQQACNHLRGQGCPNCNGVFKMASTEFIRRALLKYGDIYDFTDTTYINCYTKIKVWCKHCSRFFEQYPVHMLHRGCGCPYCASSGGEKVIQQYLLDNNINHVREKAFNDCINPKTGYKLRFDFYLQDYNICIEYDGRQHFQKEVNKYSSRRRMFDIRNIRFRDSIKDRYCQDHGINLVRIPYHAKPIEVLDNVLNGPVRVNRTL